MAKKHVQVQVQVQKQVRSNIAYVYMFCQFCLFGGKANFGEQLESGRTAETLCLATEKGSVTATIC